MKRLLKFFAFLGGLGVVGWLMRNRFVGMTLNREPQTPEPAPEPETTAQQVLEPEAEPEQATTAQQVSEPEPDTPPSTDLAQVLGVPSGDVESLNSAGITTVSQLAVADIEDLAAKTGLDQAKLGMWVEKAAALA